MKKLKTTLLIVFAIFICVLSLNAQDSLVHANMRTRFINSYPVNIVITLTTGSQKLEITVESLADLFFMGQDMKQLIISLEPTNDERMSTILENFVKFNGTILMAYSSVIQMADSIFATCKSNPDMKTGIIWYETIKAENKMYLGSFKEDLEWAVKKLKQYGNKGVKL